MSPALITTSFLLANLHCPSCVSHIIDTLLALYPTPASVSPSLLSSWVTIKHEEPLSVHDIREALEQAGFDVCDTTTDSRLPAGKSYVTSNGDIGYLDRFIHRLAPQAPAKSKYPFRHIQNCDACRVKDAGQGQHGRNSKDADIGTTAVDDGGQSISNTMAKGKTIPSLVVVDSTPSNTDTGTFRISLAVGGMTCASCVGAITTELAKKDWINNVVVNLISNSATVDFAGEEHKNEIVQAIEDIGYDAAIDSVVSLASLQENAPETVVRTVELLVDGMYCEHCPDKVMATLDTWGDRVKIEREMDLQNPILKISYTPDAPNFTIRSIVEAISGIDDSIRPSIYHPPTLEERSRQIHRREQLRILIRVIIALLVAIPTFIIGIVFMSLVPADNAGREFLERPLRAGISRTQWALFIMATPVYFLCADVFHVRALKEIRSMWRRGSKTPFLQRFYRFGSMNMLMSLGTSIAYISSTAQLVAAGVHPEMKSDNTTLYFDSVVFLTLFLLIGRLIESYSKSKTGDAITLLGKLRPTEALLVVPAAANADTADEKITGQEIIERSRPEAMQRVSVDLLEFGDIVKILHGGSPPCDGTVIQGETKFDESSLTGESRPVKKTIGDEVFSGTVNQDTPISIRISGVAGSSMLDQIVKAVREGQTRRAPIERVADSMTSYFVPAVTFTAILTWVIWLSLGFSGALPDHFLGHGSGGWVSWSLQFAIAVFVVACPCGLALAAPTAIFVGGGLAAQHGILVKGGGEAFEKASRLNCVVFDKTGTLTMGGEPVVTDFQLFPTDVKLGIDDKEQEKSILGMVSAIEDQSSHTVAKALKLLCGSVETKHAELDHVEEIAGRGMRGTSLIDSNNTANIIIGNEQLISDNAVSVSESIQATLESWKSQGRSVALAAVQVTTNDNKIDDAERNPWHLAAIFAISDPIRPEAPSIIKALRKRGLDVWMLSGDNQITANAIGVQVGIPSENIIAGVLPSQKAEKIQYLQRSLKARTASGSEHTQKRAMIAMVGDGINDSPALTTADVGIAIGSGSDIAISSAEFVLISSHLNSLITLVDLSKIVFRRIKFNFGWALVYNMIALPVAAGALYPLTTGGNHVRLDPVWASLAMAASSISVVLSSLALRSRLPWVGFTPRDVEES
ncbi:uncharacterized protein BP5553_04415 [Venustampulla echinocandica]|uniref:HMA domain-containing protein n=1 Tax=Venustampulla echinocandica TaxID=2656787 RepID=A0A370TN91_9HELO|nr:uncharacterized protein BP5553_04415 [Venustampulla echinocandica]RDL36982.1 hypothetical protein BP5553_04415 [Venustampulla echinocandica]